MGGRRRRILAPIIRMGKPMTIQDTEGGRRRRGEERNRKVEGNKIRGG
jgi:hypothetical protein